MGNYIQRMRKITDRFKHVEVMCRRAAGNTQAKKCKARMAATGALFRVAYMTTDESIDVYGMPTNEPTADDNAASPLAVVMVCSPP